MIFSNIKDISSVFKMTNCYIKMSILVVSPHIEHFVVVLNFNERPLFCLLLAQSQCCR